MKFFKNNKLSILVYVFLLILIVASFYQYFKDYYSYAPLYYEVKDKCDNGDKESCLKFENVYKYTLDPKEKFDRLDVITLTSEIVENSYFSMLQWIGPLLVIVLIIDLFHKELSSGIFKYYLNRMSYKKFLKRIMFISFRRAWVLPISLIFVFLISCFITGFNFSIHESVKNIAVYDSFKYNNFLVYGLVIVLLLFIISLFYGNLAVLCCKKNKNSLITIILSYVLFIAVDIFILVIVYSLIINNLLGFKELTDYFNITGYWFFKGNINYLLVLLIASIISVCSYILLYFSYHNKEKLIYENEKQNT